MIKHLYIAAWYMVASKEIEDHPRQSKVCIIIASALWPLIPAFEFLNLLLRIAVAIKAKI